MLGQLYDRALGGERCWIRYDDGGVEVLPVSRWLGAHHTETAFDDVIVGRCDGPTIELGCGPGRLVARLIRRGIPALGVDQSATAVRLAWRRGAPAIRADVFGVPPGIGCWQTVLVADGSVGLAGDPVRLLQRAAQLLRASGRCVVEFDAATTGMRISRVRLECDDGIGPWFRWASVGLDCATHLAQQASLRVAGVEILGRRALAILAPAL